MPWLFLLLPWVELWTLIELGSRTSALFALFYVFATLMLGLSMLRRQGLAIVQKMQREQGRGFIGPQLLQDEMAIVSSGLLLMIPGLVTDVLALVCLVGPLRRRLLALFGVDAGPEATESLSSNPDNSAPGTPPRRAGDTLEGEFRRLDD